MPQEQTDNRYTRGIAEFVSGLTYDAIPAEVKQRIKLLMLDAFGCAIYGSRLEWSRILQRVLGGLDSTRACRVWGTDQQLSAPHATLVNGTQVHGFEIDDSHFGGYIHVGSVVLPALVAIAEGRPGMSGKEFLTAAVAGYEIGPRVGLCMNPEHIAQGWHSAATVGVFGAASSAARGLRLNVEKTVHALGIAGTQASGLMAAQFGAMVKRMHAGRASQSGFYGAMLAEAGFTGIVNVFESEYGGFCTTFSRSQDRFRLAALTAGLGSVWETMNFRLKFYSCVYSNYSTLDTIRELQAEHRFGAGDVEKIVVHGAKVTVDHVGWKYRPQGMTTAPLNLAFCVATLLLEGDVVVAQFTEDAIVDPAHMALADRIEVREDPEITAKGTGHRHDVRVQLYLKDGTILERTGQTSGGGQQSLLTEQNVVNKFEKLVGNSAARWEEEPLAPEA